MTREKILIIRSECKNVAFVSSLSTVPSFLCVLSLRCADVSWVCSFLVLLIVGYLKKKKKNSVIFLNRLWLKPSFKAVEKINVLMSQRFLFWGPDPAYN